MIAQKMMMCSGSVAITIAASVRSPDIAALARSAGWNGVGSIALTINSGVDVATLSIPSTIPGSLLTLVNNGRIGGVINSGTGLTVRTSITVINNGTIFGGGGLGGTGASATIRNPQATANTATGYGGAGGAGAGFSISGSVVMLAASAGAAGTSGKPGGASAGAVATATGGAGGAGGAIGLAGSSGGAHDISGGIYELVSATGATVGAAPGNYIDGDAFVAWKLKGDVRGNAI